MERNLGYKQTFPSPSGWDYIGWMQRLAPAKSFVAAGRSSQTGVEPCLFRSLGHRICWHNPRVPLPAVGSTQPVGHVGDELMLMLAWILRLVFRRVVRTRSLGAGGRGWRENWGAGWRWSW